MVAGFQSSRIRRTRQPRLYGAGGVASRFRSRLLRKASAAEILRQPDATMVWDETPGSSFCLAASPADQAQVNHSLVPWSLFSVLSPRVTSGIHGGIGGPPKCGRPGHHRYLKKWIAGFPSRNKCLTGHLSPPPPFNVKLANE